MSQCPSCKATVAADARFCSSCGISLVERALADQKGPAIERRQLSVIFCDLVGSTTLADELDAEDWREILRGFHEICRNAVEQYQAHVAQFLGDGMMTYFGYPVAHEDDPLRALRAAQRILTDLSDANVRLVQRFGIELHVRIGIHTGEAIVGDPGPGGENDHLVMGSVMHYAARVQGIAPTDTIAVSSATAKLITGYAQLESLGTPELKGFTRRSELFRVVGSTEAQTRLQAAAGRLTPYVGRVEEVQRLGTAWLEAVAGAERLVCVTGEPGIGKSRLIEQLKREVAGVGMGAGMMVECFCTPLTEATPLAPIIEMLRSLLAKSAQSHAPEALARALRESIERNGDFIPEALPLMMSLLDLPGSGDEPLAGLSLASRRQRTLDVLRQWLIDAFAGNPVLFTIDDVQWADRLTLDLLDLLARRGTEGYSMICLTARPEFELPWHEPLAMRIELQPLTHAEAEVVVARVAGRELPFAVVRAIIERGEGIPMFVEELTREVEELMTGAAPDVALVMPPSVHASFLAPFDRLGSGRVVAQFGAAIGREFTHPLIQAVAGLDADELTGYLDQMCASRLVSVTVVDPHPVYRFRHALLQDAIYGTVPKRERAAIHQRIFEVLEREFPAQFAARPELAAYHSSRAGLGRRALPLLMDAGQRALARAAVHEAERYLNQALLLLPELSESERAQIELSLQSALAPAYMVSHGWPAPEVEHAATRQRELAIALGDGQGLFASTWGLYTVHTVRGDLDRSLELAEEVFRMASATPDPIFNLLGLQPLAYARLARGEFSEALTCVEQGRPLFNLERERQIVSRYQLTPSGTLMQVEQFISWLTGQQDRAEQIGQARRSLDFDHPPSRASLLAVGGLSLHLSRSSKTLQADMEELVRLARAEGMQIWRWFAQIQTGWANAMQGRDPVEAARAMRIGIAEQLALESRLHITHLFAMHVEVLLMADLVDESLAVADKALEQVERGGERYVEPELWRLRADALQRLGRQVEAVASCRRATAVAQAQGARSLELRAAMLACTLEPGPLSIRGLRDCYAGFTQGHEKNDLIAARAMLEAAGERIEARYET